MKPYEKAPHLAKILISNPAQRLDAVRGAMDDAIKVLKAYSLKIDHPINHDLTNPDHGIVYALSINNGNYPTHIKDAAILLRMCLRAIERGEVNSNDIVFIPHFLAAISGFVSAQASQNKGIKRKRTKPQLRTELESTIKKNPTDTWKELLNRLEGEGIVIKWDAKEIHWQDTEGNNYTTPVSTLKGWITKKMT